MIRKHGVCMSKLAKMDLESRLGGLVLGVEHQLA